MAALLLLVACTSRSDSNAPLEASAESTRSVVPQATITSTSTPIVATRSPGCTSGTDSATPRGSQAQIDLAGHGFDRWYSLFVPFSYDGERTPLVIDLHGYLSGAAGQAAMSNFARLAEDERFVWVTPQGNGTMPYWNAVPHPNLPDDIAFIEHVIDDVERQLCIDRARVYVSGFSNGAFLASLVACRLSHRVAAVAVVAGLQMPRGCEPSRPLPILAIHGTDDRYVSFGGGPNPALDELPWNDESSAAFHGLPFADVTTTAAKWAALQGCEPDPSTTTIGPSVDLIEYSGCSADSVIQLYVINGGGHTWPASAFSVASESVLGPTTHEIDASRLIWEFFEDHPLR